MLLYFFVSTKVIADVRRGSTTARIHVEVARGEIATAQIANELTGDLELEKGKKAHVPIKLPDVMIAAD